MKSKHKTWLCTSVLAMISMSFAETVYAAAASTGMSIANIATNVTASFYGIAQLITAGSYIAGMGFALAAVLKFKQHKDNPTQIPIGNPIALLFVAAALIFLPTIFGTANQTLFGGSGSAAGVTGISTF